MKRRSAFTLIELLVVIAIIAVLMAILMPALRRVKEQGKMIKCLGNLRQWNLITAMYSEENNGKVWNSDAGTPAYWWIKYLETRYKDWKSNKLWMCPSATKPIYDESGQLVPNFNIFNAWGIFTGSGLGPNGIAGSYGLNGYLLIPRTATTYEGGVSVQDGWKGLNVTGGNNIPLFVEALRFDLWPLPTHAPADQEFAAWSGNNMARCCINRHQGFLEASFADLSVRRVGLKELWKLKWHKQFDTNGPWTLPTANWPDWIKPYKDY